MKLSLDKKALFICILVLVVIRVFIAPMKDILTWDVFGYYLYLPSFFLYDDPHLRDLSWVNQLIEQYKTTATFYQAVHLENGDWVMRYPIGPALLNSPFYFLADMLAEPMGYTRDGFSTPYQTAWTLGALFYACIGLVFSRKVLRFYFSEKTVAAVLIILTLGTNLIQMATYGNPLAHIFLFGLYALAIHEVAQWKEKIGLWSALRFGFFAGLIAITRPNEIVILLLPMLWPLHKGIAGALEYYVSNLKAIAALAAGLVLGGLPQVLYWKWASGQWLFYSYQDPGVGFDFLSPHITEFLFSFRKGWFIYTPLMLLAMLGFPLLYKQQRQLFWPILGYFVLNLYITASWSNWWYAGGSYSSRSLVSSYLLMAIPMGYSLNWLAQKAKAIRLGVMVLIVLLCALNLFQFWQFQAKVLDGERVTWAYYKAIFLQTERPANADELLLVARQADPFEVMPEPNNLEESVLDSLNLTGLPAERTKTFEDGTTALILSEADIFSPAMEHAMESITSQEYAWLRIEAEVYVPDSAELQTPLLVAHFLHKEQAYRYTTTETKPGTDLKGKGWQKLSLDFMTPEVRSVKDRFKSYLWYRGKGEVYVRSMVVRRFEPTD